MTGVFSLHHAQIGALQQVAGEVYLDIFTSWSVPARILYC